MFKHLEKSLETISDKKLFIYVNIKNTLLSIDQANNNINSILPLNLSKNLEFIKTTANKLKINYEFGNILNLNCNLRDYLNLLISSVTLKNFIINILE